MLEAIGYDAATAAAFAPWDAADAVVGRVARSDRGLSLVLTEEGPCRASWGGGLLAAIARDSSLWPAAGDWCVLRRWPDHRVTLEHLLPRRTAVLRPGAGRREGQVVCANADLVGVVVTGPAPDRLQGLVELARDSGARPLLLLAGPGRAGDRAVAPAHRLAAVTEVLVCDVASAAGLRRLRALVHERRTLALLEASRGGNRLLVEALVGAEVLATRGAGPGRPCRRTEPRGELVPLPGGGAVVDVAGLCP